MPGILCSAVGDRILLSWCLQPHELKREVDSTIFKTNRRCDKLICTKVSSANTEKFGAPNAFERKKYIKYYDRRDFRKPEERCVWWVICLADTFETFFKQNCFQMLFGVERLIQPLVFDSVK